MTLIIKNTNNFKKQYKKSIKETEKEEKDELIKECRFNLLRIKHVCYNIELDNVLFPFEREDIDILVGLCSHILNNKEDFKMLPYHHSYNSYNTIGNVEYDGEYFYQLKRILEQISKSGYEDYDEFYFVWN